jgi:hypothetical protein
MLLQFEIFKSRDDLTHAITTVSLDGVKPFNLADHTGPASVQAFDHRRHLCDRLGVPFANLTVSEQVHDGRVAIVEAADIGRGASGRADAIPGCDGLITNRRRVPLMALSADCPLVLIFDPVQKALAVVHVSWRSLARGIIAESITRLADIFDTDAPCLLAGIGPSAGPCCYDVGDDFCEEISRIGGLGRFINRQGNDGPRRYDLWRAIRWSLTQAGLADNNIEIAGRCTICDDRFFSYRREGAQTGRFALVAALR